MARTKAIVEEQNSNFPAAPQSDQGLVDMDVDAPPVAPTHPPTEFDILNGDDGGDLNMNDSTAFAGDLIDDTTQELAQALLDERSKRQSLFASMFAGALTFSE